MPFTVIFWAVILRETMTALRQPSFKTRFGPFISVLMLAHFCAFAQLYVGQQTNGTPANAVGEYDENSGVGVNSALISGSDQQIQGLLLSGTTLYVSNRLANTISTYDASTGAVLNSEFITGLTSPEGLGLSGSTLYVVNAGSGSVGTYNAATGAELNRNFITNLTGPRGIAVSGDRLFVSSVALNTIGMYDSITGAPQNASFITALRSPYSIALSGSTLYVENSYDPSGSYSNGSVSTFSATTGSVINSTFITGLNYPICLATNSTLLFVGCIAGGDISQASVGSYNASTGEPINPNLIANILPYSLAVDQTGAPSNSEDWTSPTSGSWSDPANWSKSAVPETTDDVLIQLQPSAQLTVSGPTSSTEVASLTIGAPDGKAILSLNQSGNLTIDGALTVNSGGAVAMNGANLSCGSLLNGGYAFVLSNGVGSPSLVTVNGNFLQADSGLLNPSLYGESSAENDLVNVSGTASVSGILRISLGRSDGSDFFLPNTDDFFRL